MNDQATIQSSWLDYREAAQYIGFSVTRLRQFVREGNAPKFFKVGGSPRFHTDDLDRWIRKQPRGRK